jgi:molybdopterin converting factor small subunit
MALTFVIPGALREFSAGRGEVRVDGAARTAREALSLLWRECPGARDRVLDELGAVRTHINVFIDGVNIRQAGGLEAPVRAGSEIIILPAVSGG